MDLRDWTVTVTGTVVRIDRESYDKTGKNPRYIVSFIVHREHADPPPGAVLGDELCIRAKDADLPRLAPEVPQVGDRVTMRARTSGTEPSLFTLLSAEILPLS